VKLYKGTVINSVEGSSMLGGSLLPLSSNSLFQKKKKKNPKKRMLEASKEKAEKREKSLGQTPGDGVSIHLGGGGKSEGIKQKGRRNQKAIRRLITTDLSSGGG